MKKGHIKESKQKVGQAKKVGAIKCHRFDSCSAPLCPLDTDMKKRSYLKREAVCFLMLELVKPGGTKQVTIGGIDTQVIAEATEWAKFTYAPLYRRLQRASNTPSRLRGMPC